MESGTQNRDGKRVLQLPSSAWHRSYGTIIRFNDKTQLHYETAINQWRGEDDIFYFSIDRKQVYINGKAPDLLIDKLADDIGKVLYPIKVCTDENGRIQRITNSGEIGERWLRCKEKIRQYYKGSIVERGIAEMDANIHSTTNLEQRLKEDWFFSLFFSGIYDLGPYDFKNSARLELPLVPYSEPLSYAVTREITEQHTASNCLIIACKGALDEVRSAEDIVLKNPFPVYGLQHGMSSKAEGEVSLRYALYHKDFTIRSITGAGNFHHPELGVQTTSFEIYHLPEHDEV